MTIVLTLSLAASTLADSVSWEAGSTVVADINCDGELDTATIGYVDADVVIKLKLGGETDESSLRFGLGDSGRQDALCGLKATLSVRESSVEEVTETLGDLPEGYESGESCFDLNLRGGDCDSINVFWNHRTSELNWWRL